MFCWRCGARLLEDAAYCWNCGAASVASLSGPGAPGGFPAFVPEPPSAPAPLTARFTGDGLEYFRIWIVNLALTVATLGIYSAWAKVRRMQYFYRHTRLDDASFDFHGRPLPILRGRIVGLVLFAAYTGVGYISPMLQLVAFAALAAVMPWLLVQSLRFRWHNSSYRGIRFRFSGTTAGGYAAFLGYGLLTVLTIGLVGPLWHQRMKQFVHGHSSYGSSRFTFDAPHTLFYRAYAKVVGVALAVVGAIAVAIVLMGMGIAAAAAASGAPGTMSNVVLVIFTGVFAIVYIVGSATVWACARALVQAIVWQHTQLGPHRFVYSLETRRLVTIVLVNTLGVMVTLGLFKPFADVRLARCMVEAFTLVPHGSIEECGAAEGGEVTAVGDEAAELFDIDIAI
jgi:uncharacterized membrane protein YjgN (DUF898 family)